MDSRSQRIINKNSFGLFRKGSASIYPPEGGKSRFFAREGDGRENAKAPAKCRGLSVSKKWRCRRHCCHSIVAGTTAVVPARFVSHLRVANRLRRLCPLGDGELFKFYLKSSVCQRQTGLPKGNPPCAFPAVPAGVLGRREGAGIQWMQLPKAVSD